MQGKGMYAILIGIIAVLALAVAVLSIFLFVTFRQPGTAVEASASPVASSGEALPKIIPATDLKTWNPFGTAKDQTVAAIYDLKASQDHENSFVQVNLLMKYYIGDKGKKAEVYTPLVETDSLSEIKQACALYFKGLTYEDCKSPEAIPRAQDHLKEAFNRIIKENGGEDIEIIYKVIIENMIPQ